MIHCEKTPPGYRLQIEGPGKDVVKESLHLIKGIYESFAGRSKQEAEGYKKLFLSSALGLDGYCIFEAPRNSIKVDLSALHEVDRNGGDI